jgi:hypothetical protein
MDLATSSFPVPDSPVIKTVERAGATRSTSRKDFVQENRAAVGYFKKPFFRCDRAGKCAFRMSEEFGFEQFRRNIRTVDNNKRIIGTL